MSDIRNQLIKDSYNSVIQVDLGDGYVYRIGGDVPVNPIFSSGLTVYDSFTFKNGSEATGLVLTSDGNGGATWAPVSSATGNYLSISGGTLLGDLYSPNLYSSGAITGLTISGGTIYGNGSGLTNVILSVSGDTGISATTNNGNVSLINTKPDKDVVITGGTGIQVVSSYPNFGINYTGQTSFPYLPLSGGTVSGNTIFQSGLTGNTLHLNNNLYFYDPTNNIYNTNLRNTDSTLYINDGTYDILTIYDGTISLKYSGTSAVNLIFGPLTPVVRSINIPEANGTFVLKVNGQTPNASGETTIPLNYLPLSGGTITGNTIFQSGITSNTISATTYYGVNAVTGGTYSSGTITLSGTGNINTTITGLTALTPTTLYSGNGSLSGNRSVGIDGYYLNFSSSTASNLLVLSGSSVGMGTSTPSSSAVLDLTSTSKGFLPPRMTEAQRTSLTAVTGLMVYQTDGDEGLFIYKSFGWVQII
jgi:hypothetical protein